MFNNISHLLAIPAALLLLCHPTRAVAAEATLCLTDEAPPVITIVSTDVDTPTRELPDKRRDDRKKKQQTIKDILDGIAPDAMPGKAERDKKMEVEMPDVSTARTEADEFDHHNASREGIDVSHYQSHIDWERVAREGGISYVYCKATEGAEFVDDTHMYNISMAHKHGLKVGSYHYYRPNVSIEQQFRNMTSVVIKQEQDLVPMIDIEEDRGVSESRFIADLTAFVHMVERHYGKKPLLYSGENFYNRHFQGLFQDYQWMIARYNTLTPVLKDDKSYLMWQYTDKGRIPGIRGNVDRSCLMGNGTLKAVRMK